MLKSVRAKLFLTLCVLVVLTVCFVMLASNIYIKVTNATIPDFFDYFRFLGIIGLT